MEIEPSLAAYDCPAEWPSPEPPREWHQQYRPISRIDGMDATDTPLHWWVSSIEPPAWGEGEMMQMWLQLLQLYRLPTTLCTDGDHPYWP